MTQVALMGLWYAAVNYSGEGAFSTYAHHTCNGFCLNYIRDRGDIVRKPAAEFFKLPLQVTAELPAQIGIETRTPLALLIEAEQAKELTEDVEDLLGQLTLPEQIVFEMTYAAELSRDEIARRLGLSAFQVKSIEMSARVKLRISA